MTIAEERERTTFLSPSLILLVLVCAALAAAAPVVHSRFPDYLPDYLIQIPAIAAGFAYTARYRLLDAYRSWMLRGILLLSFVVPLQNTFLLKAARKYLLDDHLVFEIFRPVIILLIALTIATLAKRRKTDAHPMVVASFGVGVVGWVIATLASQHPALSIANGFFEFLCPFLAVYVLAANVPDREFIPHCVRLFVAGFLLVTISQTAGALGSMWSADNVLAIPAFADEFLEVKKNLPLMQAIGGNGYGNTDNYISLWSLIVPLAAGLYYAHRSAWWVVVLSLLLYFGLIVYSRAGLLAIMAGLISIVAHRAVILRKPSVMILTVLALIVAIHAPSSSIKYMSDGIESFVASLKYAVQGTSHEDIREIESRSPRNSDASGVDRMVAMQRGVEIVARHPTAGIGYGVYAITDKELTAPHSMLILRFAEGGFLSGASFLLLAAFPVAAGINLARNKSSDPFKIACAAALGSFMLKAAVFGATFSVGGQIAWGYAAALMIVALDQRKDVEHA